jgi:hypothetical protein
VCSQTNARLVLITLSPAKMPPNSLQTFEMMRLTCLSEKAREDYPRKHGPALCALSRSSPAPVSTGHRRHFYLTNAPSNHQVLCFEMMRLTVLHDFRASHTKARQLHLVHRPCPVWRRPPVPGPRSHAPCTAFLSRSWAGVYLLYFFPLPTSSRCVALCPKQLRPRFEAQHGGEGVGLTVRQSP